MLSENGTLVSSIVRMGVNGSEMSGREWTRHWQDGLPAGLERGGKQVPQVIILRFFGSTRWRSARQVTRDRLKALSYFTAGSSVICLTSSNAVKRLPSCSPRSSRGDSPCFIALNTSGASRFCNSNSHTPATSQHNARA